MAGKVWLSMLDQIAVQAELAVVPFELTDKLCKASKAKAGSLIQACIGTEKRK